MKNKTFFEDFREVYIDLSGFVIICYFVWIAIMLILNLVGIASKEFLNNFSFLMLSNILGLALLKYIFEKC